MIFIHKRYDEHTRFFNHRVPPGVYGALIVYFTAWFSPRNILLVYSK